MALNKNIPGGPYKARYHSPIGVLEVAGGAKGISSLRFADGEFIRTDRIVPCLEKCLKQLDEYFMGRRKSFSLKLNFQGTEFQKKVWGELLKIPFGRTLSYRDVARALDNEKAARAVGSANHRNPIPIIIPCHRVVGAGGRLTGYGGGLERKEWLLEHEKKT